MYETDFANYILAAGQTVICTKWGEVFEVSTAGSTDTLTLARPTKPGMLCAVVLNVDGGDLTLTVTGGYNADAATSITFADATDAVVFYSVQAGTSYYWRVLAHEGTNVADEDLTVDQATVTTADITNASLGRVQITATAVNAAGSAIGNAANLSYGMNIVAGTDNTTGVILPVAVANGCVEILQTVNGKQLAVYPQVNSAIAGLTANVALNTGVANTAATAGTTQNVYFKFVATNTTQWYASR
jgi:hypothetical protein